MGYALKVVALEYQSNEAPNEVIAFYKDQLKRYGDVLDCHTTGLNVNSGFKRHDDSNAITCEGDNGHNIELKDWVRENQHIVAVEPAGCCLPFSLVSVRTHGKDPEI